MPPVATMPREPASTDAARPDSARGWLRSMADDRFSQVLFVVLAVVVTLGYTITLPFAFTQRWSLANWQFLTGRLFAFAVGLGIGMALVLTTQVFAFRRAAAARRAAAGGAMSGFAMVLSLLPTFLCCTPIIPTVLASAGVSAVSVYSTTGSLQHFFAVHETAFFVASLMLMAATGWWSIRRLTRAHCLTDTCNPPPPRP